METLVLVLGAIAALASAFSVGQLIIDRRNRKEKKDEVMQMVKDHDAELKAQQKKIDLIERMVLGSLYDRAKHVGEAYIKRGHISMQEYSDWIKYLYQPYKDAGGDGTIDKIAAEINELPIEG